MSGDELKEFVRRELAAWNEGQLEVIDELYAATFVDHFTGQTPSALKHRISTVRSAFPDVQIAIDGQVVEGDTVVSRWTARGTHLGTFMGAPATQKAMEQTGITMLRVADGMIVEGWSRSDEIGLLQQLGLLSAASDAMPSTPFGNGTHATFMQMAADAYWAVPTIKAADLLRRQKKEPELLVIDVRDAADIAQTGTVPGSTNLSLGALTYLADHEVPESWRDARLADHDRPIVTTCILGPMGALAGKLLHDMGFTNVQVLEGGVQAWMDAGLPVVNA